MKMLKFSALSLALLPLANIAHAQNSVTMYGIVDDAIQYVNHANGLGQSRVGLGAGNLSGSRWGLRGSEDLGGGLKTVFRLENGFNPNTGALGQGGLEFGRQAYVGLSSAEFGSVTLGRQYDPNVDLVQGITNDRFGASFATAGDIDNYDNSARTNNSVKYSSPTFGGLQFVGMYALGGVAGQTGSGQTWSGAAAYSNGPLSVAAGYSLADNSSTAGAKRSAWSSTWGGTFNSTINTGYVTAKSVGIARVAIQYVVASFTLGASYSNSQFKNDAQSLFRSTEKYNTAQAFLNYQATPSLLLGSGYSYTKANGNTAANYNQVSLIGDYSLSKRTELYLVGAWQRATGTQLNANGTTTSSAQASVGSYGISGTATQAIASVGIRHKF